jgi:PAS domain S-box-containing protein
MRHQIMALLSVLKDAETGQRGFLLTGGEQYLEPYNNAISSISGQLALLHTLNALNSGPLTDLERLESLASAKLAELEESIKLYRYGKAAEARGLVGTNQGKALMDEIRVIGERIQQSAETRLASFIAVQNDSTAKLRAVSMLGSGLLFLFLIIAARVIHGGIIQRDLLYKESEATKNLFVTTLTGIADGVIATDTTAKVTFINPVAEELTGRSKEEALGKHIAEVFPVVNETTHAKVDNPLEKALGEGVAVGLANPTNLISKGGIRFPIDDSAAPLKNEHGKLIGAVLVFRDISPRRRSERQLEEAVSALQRSNRELQQFVNGAAHDLRSPLNVIRNIRSCFP